MKGNFKYKFEENKEKILLWAGLGLVGALIIGGGAYFLLGNKKDHIYDSNKLANAVLADQLLVTNSKGDLDLVNIKDSKTLSTLDLTENVLIAKTPNLDGAMVFDKDKGIIFKVNTKVNKLTKEKVLELNDKVEVMVADEFKTNGKEFVFVGKDSVVIVDEKGKMSGIESKWINPDTVEITDKALYLTKGDDIIVRPLTEKKSESIEIGDQSIKLQESGNDVLAYNKFGTGLGNRMVARIKDGKTSVKELKKVTNLSSMMLDTAADETYISLLNYGNNPSAEPELSIWNTVGVDEKGELTKDSEATTIDISTVGAFSVETSKVVKGYLYNVDAEEGTISITQTKNGRESERVSVDVAKTNVFYVPIYK